MYEQSSILSVGRPRQPYNFGAVDDVDETVVPVAAGDTGGIGVGVKTGDDPGAGASGNGTVVAGVASRRFLISAINSRTFFLFAL